MLKAARLPRVPVVQRGSHGRCSHSAHDRPPLTSHMTRSDKDRVGFPTQRQPIVPPRPITRKPWASGSCRNPIRSTSPTAAAPRARAEEPAEEDDASGRRGPRNRASPHKTPPLVTSAESSADTGESKCRRHARDGSRRIRNGGASRCHRLLFRVVEIARSRDSAPASRVGGAVAGVPTARSLGVGGVWRDTGRVVWSSFPELLRPGFPPLSSNASGASGILRDVFHQVQQFLFDVGQELGIQTAPRGRPDNARDTPRPPGWRARPTHRRGRRRRAIRRRLSQGLRTGDGRRHLRLAANLGRAGNRSSHGPRARRHRGLRHGRRVRQDQPGNGRRSCPRGDPDSDHGGYSSGAYHKGSAGQAKARARGMTRRIRPSAAGSPVL